jgi:eukaryotic-like serine/threonine-protein kinase
VMEYIEGGSLQDYLDIHGAMDWRDVARVGAEVAAGLAAAHAQGLIHRDIKPSNILVQTNGAKNVLGVSKIGDFGLARIADESRLTQTGIVAGTPMYMSPEQAEGDALDARADLFSLGSLLYALCTGGDPFPGASPLAVLRQVVHARPRPIRELNRSIPSWLAGLVERLHAKRPENRCASAAEVAELLRYNLAHPDQPRLVAPPPSARPRWRNPRWVLAGIVAASLLLAGGLGVRQVLRNLPRGGDSSSAAQDNPAPPHTELTGHTSRVFTVAFSPDGKFLATSSDDSTLRVWDAATGKEVMSHVERSPVSVIVFAHSGNFLLGRANDGTLHQWGTSDWKETDSFPKSNGTVRRMALSADDRTLAIPTTEGIELWDLATRTQRVLAEQTDHIRRGSVSSIAFAPDDKTLATSYSSGAIQLWDPVKEVELQTLIADPHSVIALAFTPDGRILSSAGGNGEVKFWDFNNGKYDQPIATLSCPKNRELTCMAISPDGHLLATGSYDGIVMLWDLQNLSTVHSLLSFQSGQGRIASLTFSPDNVSLATAGDKSVSLWDLTGLETAKP